VRISLTANQRWMVHSTGRFSRTTSTNATTARPRTRTCPHS
jgi:hypothetical protein